MSLLIDAKGLTKIYPKVGRSRDRLHAMTRLLLGSKLPDSLSQTVLSDVSLQVSKGESLAIIGENGAGKSTLLKLLTGVISASRGSVSVHGQIGALLELGAGFHPDYTGRENLKLAGALYGFTGDELREKTQAIEAFADIGSYIDEPVKHYSSGMVVRLGFALLAMRRPELLITDEVLAVGDESFQKKCTRWIEDYLSNGGTLLLVSHSMYHVQKLCRKALWLQKGKVAGYGDVFDVSQAYLAYHERKNADAESKAFKTDSHDHYRVLAVDARVNDGEWQRGESALQPFAVGAQLELTIEVFAPDDRAPTVLVGIVRADGTPVYGVTNDEAHESAHAHAAQRTRAQHFQIGLRFTELNLLPGSYALKVHTLDPEGVRLFDTQIRDFTIRGQSREFGLVRLPHQWHDVER
jgi:lipopolysaccharide transport system ATP-binding protein